MNSEKINIDNISDEMPQRAVSLYGQNDGVEDFPVLKAFQQYIDAEQEKARKRILWLGIFFGAILIVVIAVFLFLLYSINIRNQTLSDRLFDAMKESVTNRQMPPAVVASPTSPQNEAVLKSMTETLVAIQKKIQDNGETKFAAPTAVDPKIIEEQEKIRRVQAALDAEKKRLDEERERLRQIEIDRQRRKLYPELYEDAPSHSRSKTRMLTDDDIREIIREAYPDIDEKQEEKTNKPAAENISTTEQTDEDTPIDYFKDDDYNIPIDVKGSASKIKFTVPID